MTFVEHEGKAKLITSSQYTSIDDLQKVMDMGVVEEFGEQFDCLDGHLKESSKENKR